jgi:hypothetical protein
VLITLQSALAGEPMKNVRAATLFSPRRVQDTIERVYAWWQRLQACFPVQRVELTGALYDEAVLRPVERFQSRYVLEAAAARERSRAPSCR